MRLCHNIMSLNVYRNYTKALSERSQAMNSIESGSKLNNKNSFSGAFGRSEEFSMQIKGLHMANKNLQDGFSMIQTVEGGLSEISSSLVRIKELTVQAANGSYNKDDLNAMQKEINQIKGNISDIVKNTDFNGVKLMDNKDIDPKVAADPKAKSANTITHYLESISGANVGDIIKIPQYSISIENLGIGKGKCIGNIDVTNTLNKGNNIEIADTAIDQIDSIRSTYGSVEQRLNSASDDIGSNLIPMKKAKSYLSDADVAKEMMKFVRADLLTQASNAMMVQSNDFPENSLRVLQSVK